VERKNSRWESELWTYISTGDGRHCPIYETCQTRLEGDIICFSEHVDYWKPLTSIVNSNFCGSGELTDARFKLLSCTKSGRIFQLVGNLAKKYHVEAGIDHQDYDHLPIEVQWVSLKAYHGAVWRLSNRWLVQLNSNDTIAYQRFALYHEIFHILAHCKATPVFNKVSGTGSQQGSFNELLADHFAAVMLLPEKWVKESWNTFKDINQIAAIFDAPKALVWFVLHNLHFI